MNHFFFSNEPDQGRRAPAKRRLDLHPVQYVVRKADGRNVTINQRDFHPALHEVPSLPEEAKVISVNTATGNSVIELNHEILERMPEESILALDICKYVVGYNTKDKRGLIVGILELLGHTESATEALTIEEREAKMLAEWEAEQAKKEEAKPAAKKPAAKKAAAPKKDEAPEA